MADQIRRTKELAPFGAEVQGDLSFPLQPCDVERIRSLMNSHKLLLWRNQNLAEENQVELLSALGRVLGTAGEYREISSDGNLGAGPLAYHSDLAFTEAPFRYLSLHALDVNDGQSWTSFANGVLAADTLPPSLRSRVDGREARTVISVVQSHRAVTYDNPEFLPQQLRPVLIEHPITGELVLYISEMQTARIEGLGISESDELLQRLFDHLYAPANVYRHYWRNGDVVMWDNIALQHARCDLAGMVPRRLQRVAVADKSFFELCPQFALDDPRVAAWASGDALEIA